MCTDNFPRYFLNAAVLYLSVFQNQSLRPKGSASNLMQRHRYYYAGSYQGVFIKFSSKLTLC